VVSSEVSVGRARYVAGVAGPVICDLDGVIWLADQPIPGAADAVRQLRESGRRVLFVSNNSFSPVGDVEAKLARFGIPAEGDVLTSARAAARLVSRGERVLLLGGPGIEGDLVRAGAELVHDGPCDSVVVGFHRTFDYDGLRRGAVAVRNGARLIGTNDDSTYPTPDGPIPGCGAILAAVATGAGVEPLVAGKPYAPMAELVKEVVGVDAAFNAVMIGDRFDTDGRFAVTLGCRFALVLSGVAQQHEIAAMSPAPAYVADSIAELVGVI
jgi:HAD superfamily hydrolase (TIGR01450 family)